MSIRDTSVFDLLRAVLSVYYLKNISNNKPQSQLKIFIHDFTFTFVILTNTNLAVRCCQILQSFSKSRRRLANNCLQICWKYVNQYESQNFSQSAIHFDSHSNLLTEKPQKQNFYF